MPNLHTFVDEATRYELEKFKDRYASTNAESIPYMIRYALIKNPESFGRFLGTYPNLSGDHRIQITVDEEVKSAVKEFIGPQKEVAHMAMKFSLKSGNDFAQYFAGETVTDEWREENYNTNDEPDEIVGEKKFRDMDSGERRKYVDDDIDALGTADE